MTQRRGSFFEAVAFLVGTIIGAGILGIPFVVAKVGALIGGAYILGAGLLFLLLNLMMGETVARTKRSLQLVGLAEKYLGRAGQQTATVVIFLSAWSAMLAYIIGEGAVLAAIFGGPAFWWSVAFFIGGALILATNLKAIARVEFLFTLAIFAIVIALALASAPHIARPHLATISFADFFLPFGVMIFAFGGSTAIPQMEELLKDQPGRLRRAIILGSIIPIVIYLLFALVVVGVTGINTTAVATIGLGNVIGPWMIVIGNVFAFFTMSTSFVMLGFILMRSLQWDYHLTQRRAWLATIVVPAIIFISGARDFIAVLGITGAIFGGIISILIVVTFWRAHRVGDIQSRTFNLHYGIPIGVFLIIIFIIGSTYSVIQALS